jgi:hypothetical protein
MNLLAKADLDAQHIGRGLRPERVGGTGAREPRHHQPVDLTLFNARLVEQLFQNLA